MTLFYLASALLIAALIGHGAPLLRALGRLLAASLLIMIASSILLANLDGTFAAAPGWRVWSLNAMALAAVLAAAGLLRAAWAGRARPATPPAHNRLVRALHWTSAALVIAAVPMGQFITVLTPQAPERTEFLLTHTQIGAALLLLIAARLITRLLTPGPATALPSMAAHTALYALLIALCLTGLALTQAPVQLLSLTFPRLPPSSLAETLHRFALPALLLLAFATHLLAARPIIRRIAP
jgi:cytochrome b561